MTVAPEIIALLIIFVAIPGFIGIVQGTRLRYINRNNSDLFPEFCPHFQFQKFRLDLDQVNILNRYSRYYRKLPEKFKPYYESRIIDFIEDKNFSSRNDFRITEEMKILIAESAVKLTFGLKSYMFDKFNQIIIFKEEYYSRFTKTKNIGETNPVGAIIFSWKDFLERDINDTNGLNLGLHEFAHALMIQNMDEDDFIDEHFFYQKEYLENYFNKDVQEANNINLHQLFRKYGFRNKMEFFSVAVERFFETPEKIKSDIPELYEIMRKMLNQDVELLYRTN